MTTLTLSGSAAGSTKADALVLAIEPAEGGASIAGDPTLPRAARRHIESTIEALEAEGGAGEFHLLASVPDIKAPVVALVGLGSPAAAQPRVSTEISAAERVRRAAGTATRRLRGRAVVAFAFGTASAEAAAPVAEGAILGAYSFDTFTGKGKKDAGKAPVTEVVVIGVKPRSKEAKELQARVGIVTDAVRYARDLVNTPPNVLYPETFATSVTGRAKDRKVSKLKVETWDVDRLTAEGCGGIIGVGQGSAHGPRLTILKYRPSKPVAHIALIGKGITFDSGGLCIKPAGSMITMKCDMAGAAAVAAATVALAELGVPVAVTTYLCLAENLTGENAQRPGDVVTMRGGKTVEIINTDAEGRLVMADGLALASEEKPDAIIDVATLTGAAMIALGNRTFGVMGNDDALRDRVDTAATDAGEVAWAMPIAAELRSGLNSKVADLKHTGARAGGMMVAARFLQEFIGEDDNDTQIPWAHVDIAGPAFNDESAWGYTPAGGTGASVRTLIALAESYTTA